MIAQNKDKFFIERFTFFGKLNPYFINDLDIKGFKLWIAGHTHTSVDTVVDGCRLVINPLGYPPEQGKNGFRENLIIEV